MSQQRGDSRFSSAAQSYVHRLAKKWAILAFDCAFLNSCIVGRNVDTYPYLFIRAKCKGLNILCLICPHSLRLISHAFVAQFGSSFLTLFHIRKMTKGRFLAWAGYPHRIKLRFGYSFSNGHEAFLQKISKSACMLKYFYCKHS